MYVNNLLTLGLSFEVFIKIVWNGVMKEFLFFSAEKVFFEDHMKYFRVSVQSNGQMQWHPAGIYRTTCPLSVTYFPYDSQVHGHILQGKIRSTIVQAFKAESVNALEHSLEFVLYSN